MTYLILLLIGCYALQQGTLKNNHLLPMPISYLDKSLDTKITLDSNWRWIHYPNGRADNCFAGKWLCENSEACTKCEIEGVPFEEWARPYGISAQNGKLRLNYVTEGPYGTNVGSRVYLLDSTGDRYQGFDLRGLEFSFTVDVSNLPCGLNGALYLVEMPLSNPFNSKLSSAYGINYGDAQCPKDIKYIQGKANMGDYGACSNEYDLWEANAHSTAIALHPCSVQQVFQCSNNTACGAGSNRYKGVCDKDGADYNPNRHGKIDLYGRGKNFQVDTTYPFQVTVQFHTDSQGKVNRIVRFFRQHGKKIMEADMTESQIKKWKSDFGEVNHHEILGGFKTLSESMNRKHVLVMSLWDDGAAKMRWLDSIYPEKSTRLGSYRGPCSNEDSTPQNLRKRAPQSYVIFSDIKIQAIDTVSTPIVTTPTPTLPSTQCAKLYGQCGGKNWDGARCCLVGKCNVINEWYSQCEQAPVVPSPSPSPRAQRWVCQQCVLSSF